MEKSNFRIKHKEFLINVKQTCTLLSMSRSTVYKMIKEGGLPKPIKMGNRSKWRYGDLLDWIKEQEKKQNG